MCKTRRIIAFLLAMLIAIPTISLSTVRAAEEGSDITKITVVKGKDINDMLYGGKKCFIPPHGGTMRMVIKIQHFVLIPIRLVLENTLLESMI